jgi:hypothetical protein
MGERAQAARLEVRARLLELAISVQGDPSGIVDRAREFEAFVYDEEPPEASDA